MVNRLFRVGLIRMLKFEKKKTISGNQRIILLDYVSQYAGVGVSKMLVRRQSC